MYSLAMNDAGTVIVAGGTDKVRTVYCMCHPTYQMGHCVFGSAGAAGMGSSYRREVDEAERPH